MIWYPVDGATPHNWDDVSALRSWTRLIESRAISPVIRFADAPTGRMSRITRCGNAGNPDPWMLASWFSSPMWASPKFLLPDLAGCAAISVQASAVVAVGGQWQWEDHIGRCRLSVHSRISLWDGDHRFLAHSPVRVERLGDWSVHGDSGWLAPGDSQALSGHCVTSDTFPLTATPDLIARATYAAYHLGVTLSMLACMVPIDLEGSPADPSTWTQHSEADMLAARRWFTIAAPSTVQVVTDLASVAAP